MPGYSGSRLKTHHFSALSLFYGSQATLDATAGFTLGRPSSASLRTGPPLAIKRGCRCWLVGQCSGGRRLRLAAAKNSANPFGHGPSFAHVQMSHRRLPFPPVRSLTIWLTPTNPRAGTPTLRRAKALKSRRSTNASMKVRGLARGGLILGETACAQSSIRASGRCRSPKGLVSRW